MDVDDDGPAALCRLDDIPDGGAKGIEVADGAGSVGVIVLREGSGVRCYLNRCPHRGTRSDLPVLHRI